MTPITCLNPVLTPTPEIPVGPCRKPAVCEIALRGGFRRPICRDCQVKLIKKHSAKIRACERELEYAKKDLLWIIEANEINEETE